MISTFRCYSSGKLGTIALPGGRALSVVAKNLSKENMFVKSATFNGKPVDKTISHADIMSGGELVFEMGR